MAATQQRRKMRQCRAGESEQAFVVMAARIIAVVQQKRKRQTRPKTNFLLWSRLLPQRNKCWRKPNLLRAAVVVMAMIIAAVRQKLEGCQLEVTIAEARVASATVTLCDELTIQNSHLQNDNHRINVHPQQLPKLQNSLLQRLQHIPQGMQRFISERSNRSWGTTKKCGKYLQFQAELNLLWSRVHQFRPLLSHHFP